ncbi:MAG TPA: ABC transporter ATP-binding protein [Candidatus Binatia bacterium]|nr:ABC transporter ATP-binding protein [Candidatus Binatia bacterium]
MIRAVNLHKSFRRQQVLNGVNLEIPDGSIYVIIGRSGAGKSVLLKHFIGLLRPDEGEVWVDGEEISKLHGRALNRVRSRFGMLFQGGALFDSLTVYDNVAFPLREKTRLSEAVIREKVQERLAQVGLSGIDEKFPSELSGGMRKRVALARALISEPEFLLFDEPTTGLDPIRVNSIHQLILDLHRLLHLTAVVVSHEIPEIFSLATHVAMLHEGVIVATGTPAEIQASSDPVVHQFITGQTEGPIGSTE